MALEEFRDWIHLTSVALFIMTSIAAAGGITNAFIKVGR